MLLIILHFIIDMRLIEYVYRIYLEVRYDLASKKRQIIS